MRRIILGPAFIFSVVSFGILADFTRKAVAQQGLLSFEILGLCLGSLTLILLPVIIIVPQYVPDLPFIYRLFEFLILASLGGLWTGFTAQTVAKSRELYAPPDANLFSFESSCRFVIPKQEARQCYLLNASWICAVCIAAFLFLFILVLVAKNCRQPTRSLISMPTPNRWFRKHPQSPTTPRQELEEGSDAIDLSRINSYQTT